MAHHKFYIRPPNKIKFRNVKRNKFLYKITLEHNIYAPNSIYFYIAVI